MALLRGPFQVYLRFRTSEWIRMVVQKLAPCVVGLTGKVKKLSFGQLVSVSPLKRFRSNKNKTFLSLQFGPTALTSKKTSTENRFATVLCSFFQNQSKTVKIRPVLSILKSWERAIITLCSESVFVPFPVQDERPINSGLDDSGDGPLEPRNKCSEAR
jgi:hypothetical protein